MQSCYALLIVLELMLMLAAAVAQQGMTNKFGMQQLPAALKMYSKLAESIESVKSVDTTIGALGAPQPPDKVCQRFFQTISSNYRPFELPESWENAAKRIPLLCKQFREIGVLYGSYKVGEDGSRGATDIKWQRHVTTLAEKFHAQVRIELFMLTPSGIDIGAIYEPLFAKCVVAPLVEMAKH